MMFWPKAEESNPSSRSAHESRNEAVITVAMDQWRKAYRRHAHATEGAGRGLGGLFFGSNRRHRSFSSAVITRGQHIHRSGAPEKQANFRLLWRGVVLVPVPHHRLVTDLHRLTSREFLDNPSEMAAIRGLVSTPALTAACAKAA